MSGCEHGSREVARVKICGHTTTGDVRASIAAGADAVGVIAQVSVDTPREVSVDRAIDLVRVVPPLVTSVLVTMPETATDAIDLAERVQPDVLQLHGRVPPTVLESVVDSVEVPVIGAVDAGDTDLADAYDDVADLLLVDSTDARGAGGTGRTHDWERTVELVSTLDSPVLLAGGLTPENVAEAVSTVNPFGVDVASGVEREGEHGRKDHDDVRRFVANARGSREVVV